MRLDRFGADGLERAVTWSVTVAQPILGRATPRSARCRNAGRRSGGDRATMRGVDGLVALGIRGRVGAIDMRRQRTWRRRPAHREWPRLRRRTAPTTEMPPLDDLVDDHARKRDGSANCICDPGRSRWPGARAPPSDGHRRASAAGIPPRHRRKPRAEQRAGNTRVSLATIKSPGASSSGNSRRTDSRQLCARRSTIIRREPPRRRAHEQSLRRQIEVETRDVRHCPVTQR